MLPFSKAHAYGNDFLYVRPPISRGADGPAAIRSAIGTRALALMG